MKKNLLLFSWSCFFLLFSAIHLIAQVRGNPPQINSIDYSQLNITKSSSVLSSNLSSLYKRRNPNATKGAKQVVLQKNGLEKFLQIKGDQILIDITVKDDMEEAKAELAKIGFKVKSIFGRVISGSIAINLIPTLDGAKNIKFAKPAYKPFHKSKLDYLPFKVSESPVSIPQPVISQGDTLQRSNLARSKFGVKGTGVKVGILSDSYNSLGTADLGVSQGELPGPGNPFNYNKPVQILEEYFYFGTDEGRALAEIVHDVAPGAELAFHTAFNGEADFAQGIIDLQRLGCKVIVDDVGWVDEPFFQDGIIAQAVDEVKSKGVVYFSAAGNSGRRSYESSYRPTNNSPLGTIMGTAHNFSNPGDPPVYFLPIFIPLGGEFTPTFQWDDPFYSAGGEGAKTDLDIFLLDSQGKLAEFSNEDNIVSGDPYEFFSYKNTTNSNTFYVVILKKSGPDPTRVKYLDWGSSSFYLTAPPIPGILATTLVGHAKAEGAIATAAAPFFGTPAYGVDTPFVENFSSLGGVANYFDVKGNRINPKVRYKPEITAPDGGNNSFFPPYIYYGNQDIPQDSDTFPNFFGTSAAAPHAAGVAALMIEARKAFSYSPDQVAKVLAANAKDMDNPHTQGFDKGFDFKTGMGLINAEAAVGFIVQNTKASKVGAEITKSDKLIDKVTTAEVFPNPSSTSFRIKLPTLLSGVVEMQLLSADGRLIFRRVTPVRGVLNIDASGLKAGTYFLKLKQGEFVKNFKLIKQ